MSIRFFLLPLLLWAPLILAQPSFLNNPDIIWAARIIQDVDIDFPSLKDEGDRGMSTLKLLRTPKNEDYFEYYPSFANLLDRAVWDKQIPAFEDSIGGKPFIWENQFSDPTPFFNPETQELETVQITCNLAEPLVEYVHHWRLQQILYYDKSTANWNTFPEALTPMIVQKDSNGDSIRLKALYWVKPDNKRRDIRSNNISWAKSYSFKISILPEMEPQLRILKNRSSPLEHQMTHFWTAMKTPYFDASRSHNLLSQEERINIGASVDSLILINPKTQAETQKVIRNYLNPNDLHRLKLLQHWYWNEETNQVSICLEGMMPLRTVLDEDGNFRYEQQLFYRKAGGPGKRR